jgi:hypothetical protein
MLTGELNAGNSPERRRRRSVAIWGSCVSRDAFAVQSRAAQIEDNLSLVYYGARSSWISQDSRPWPDPAPVLDGTVSGFGRRMVQEDLTKQIPDRLVEQQPDLVVIDLVDERLPLVRRGETWLTASDYLRQTDLGASLLAEPSETSTITAPGRRALFTAAVPRLVTRLVRDLPQTTFVLHEAPYVTRISDGRTLPEPRATWARELQAAQRPLFRALARAFGRRMVRATPPPQVCAIDPEHRWGIASYHYVESYYHWLLDTLLAIEPQASAPPTRWSSPRRWLTSRSGNTLVRR